MNHINNGPYQYLKNPTTKIEAKTFKGSKGQQGH